MENKKTNLIGNKQPGGQATPSGFYFCRRKKGGKDEKTNNANGKRIV